MVCLLADGLRLSRGGLMIAPVSAGCKRLLGAAPDRASIRRNAALKSHHANVATRRLFQACEEPALGFTQRVAWAFRLDKKPV